MNDEQLLPCPFCGCEKIKLEQFCKNGILIKCTRCIIQYKQKVLRNSLDWLKDIMIKDWNTRIEPKKTAIEFKEWQDENLEDKRWENYDGHDTWINPHTREVKSTSDLYELFLKQKQ